MSGTQSNWRWCHKCQSLFFGGASDNGACPAGNAHENQSSGDYFLYQNCDVGGPKDWRWCSKCQGIWFSGNHTDGICPRDHRGHDLTGSGDYILGDNYNQNTWPNKVTTSTQDNWRWCSKCQGLFFGGHQAASRCPAGGTHDPTGSGNYILNQDPFKGVPPVINVSHPDSSFHVTGSGFRSSATVTVRVVDDQLRSQNFSQSATPSGQLDMTVRFSCDSGSRLYFSSTDDGGNLWSNIFVIPC